MPVPFRPRVMLDVIEEHLEELGFLLEHRAPMVFAGDLTVHDLEEVEDRAEAHLDGLRIAGSAANDLARSRLTADAWSEVAAAAMVLLENGMSDAVLDSVRAGGPVIAGVQPALRHSSLQPFADAIYDLAVGADVALRALAADVLAFHRLHAPPDLAVLLAADDVQARRMGWGAVGRFGKPLEAAAVARGLHDPETVVRRATLEAAAQTGLSALVDLCRATARRCEPDPEAVQFLGLVGDATDLRVLEAAVEPGPAGTAALAGIGALGEPRGIETLLEAMKREEMAEAAAAAFLRILGPADIHARRQPLDLSSESDEDEETSLPDPDRARAIWEHCRSAMARGTRWQGGIDVTAMTAEAALPRLSPRDGREHWLRCRARALGDTPDFEPERWVRHGRHLPIKVRQSGR